MNVVGMLTVLERVTRPLGHDTDEPVEPASLDDVVAQLVQVACYLEDIRNLLHSLPGIPHPGGAAAGSVIPPAEPAAIRFPDM